MKRSTSAAASQNVLLLKDDVGRPKPNTRRLPNKAFVYGKAEYRDLEGAQQGK